MTAGPRAHSWELCLPSPTHLTRPWKSGDQELPSWGQSPLLHGEDRKAQGAGVQGPDPAPECLLEEPLFQSQRHRAYFRSRSPTCPFPPEDTPPLPAPLGKVSPPRTSHRAHRGHAALLSQAEVVSQERHLCSATTTLDGDSVPGWGRVLGQNQGMPAQPSHRPQGSWAPLRSAGRPPRPGRPSPQLGCCPGRGTLCSGGLQGTGQ